MNNLFTLVVFFNFDQSKHVDIFCVVGLVHAMATVGPLLQMRRGKIEF
jgi:hypothetical protein